MEGFYVRDAIDACTACGNVNDLWWLGPFILFLAVVGTVIMAYRHREFLKAWTKRNAEWLEMSANDVSARLTALFVNMQVRSSLPLTFDIL